MKVSSIVVFFLTLALQGNCHRQKVLLDDFNDLKFGWSLKGDYLFVPDIDQLHNIKDKLPADFHFKGLSTVKGIWVVVPENNEVAENATVVPSVATFRYFASAQLLETIQITHNSRGEGVKIFIRSGSMKRPLYTISATDVAPTEWITTEVPLEQHNRFEVEIHTEKSGDYVMIDKIEGIFVEVTTSTTSTTPEPEPEPFNSANHYKWTVNIMIGLIFVVAILIMM